MNAHTELNLLKQQIRFRIHELHLLGEALTRAENGGLELIFLNGRQGIGKSELINTFLRDNPAVRYSELDLASSRYNDEETSQIKRFASMLENLFLSCQSENQQLILQRLSAFNLNFKNLRSLKPYFATLLGCNEEPDHELDELELFHELLSIADNLASSSAPLMIHIKSGEKLTQKLASLVERAHEGQKYTNILIVISFCEESLGPGSHVSLLQRALLSTSDTPSSINRIDLDSMGLDLISRLLEEFLAPAASSTLELAEVLLEKTSGAPNHIKQYLDLLIKKGLVYQSDSDHIWKWDISSIRNEKSYSSDLDAFLELFPVLTDTQLMMLCTIASIGFSIDEASLAKLFDALDIENYQEHLNYFLELEILKRDRSQELTTFALSNPKVAEILLYNTDPELRRKTHHTIVDILFASYQNINTSLLYKLADQFAVNYDQGFIDRITSTRVFMTAGYAAKVRANYERSSRYFEMAFMILDDNIWRRDYSSALFVIRTYLLVLQELQKHDLVEKHGLAACQRYLRSADKTPIIEIIIDSYKAQDRHANAIELGRKQLAVLGYHLPSDLYILRTLFIAILIFLRLGTKPEKRLTEAPISKNARVQAIMRLNQQIGASSYMAEPDLMPLLSLKSLLYSLKKGVTVESAQAVVMLGLILQIGIKSPVLSSYFHRIGLSLASRFANRKPAEAVIGFYFNGMIRPWQEPLKVCEDALGETFTQCVLAKEYETAAFTNVAYFATATIRGHELASLDRKMELAFPQLQEFNQNAQVHIHKIIWQGIRNLCYPNRNPTQLVGDKYNERDHLEFHRRGRDKTVSFTYYYTKAFMAVIYGEHEQALKAYRLGKRIIKGAYGLPFVTMFHLFHTLSKTSTLRRSSTLKRLTGVASLLPNTLRLRHYAKHCSYNYAHLYDLHIAELLSLVPGLDELATRYYKRANTVAISEAKFHDAALINERMAGFFKATGAELDKIKHHAEIAAQNYAEAGYKEKHRRLCEQYDIHGTSISLDISNQYIQSILPIFRRFTMEQLNIIRLENAIIEETTRLISAHNGLLILKQPNGAFRVRSQFVFPGGKLSRWENLYTEFSQCVPEVIDQVLKSQNSVIISDTLNSDDLSFQNLSSSEIGSICCLPLVDSSNQAVGALYFESEQREAFDQHHVNLAKLVASQAVSSLEITSMYQSKIRSDSDRSAYQRHMAKTCHEINTPLNTFNVSLQLLRRTFNIPDDNAYYRRALDSVQQAIRLSQDTIDYEKIKEGKLSLKNEDFSLKEIISLAFQAVSLKAEEKTLHLRFPILTDIHDHYHGDPFRLSQVLNNLLGNAIKFTDSGYVACDVRVIEGSEATETLEFRISNTGDPIPASYMNKIFTEYTQADSSTTRKHGGYGLGLAISKQLIELMKGHLYLDQDKPITTFVFTVPLTKADINQFNPVRLDFEELYQTDSYSQLLQGSAIVVIDDDSEDRAGLVDLLKGFGASITSFESPLAALKYLAKNHTDLVLTDIEMPGIDGYRFAEELQRTHGQSMPGVLALSGHRMQGIEEKCLASGMSGYLAKPYSITQLVTKVCELLGINTKEAVASDLKAKQRMTDLPICPDLCHLNLEQSLFLQGTSNQSVLAHLKNFLSERYQLAERIIDSTEKHDLKAAAALAHKLKNSANRLGAFRLADICLSIEKSSGPADETVLADLINETDFVKSDISAQLNHMEKLGCDTGVALKTHSLDDFFTSLLQVLAADSPSAIDYKEDIKYYLMPVAPDIAKELSDQISSGDLDTAHELLCNAETAHKAFQAAEGQLR